MAYDSIDLSDYEEEDEGSGENFSTNLTATVHTPLNSAGMIKVLNDFRNQTTCIIVPNVINGLDPPNKCLCIQT